METKNKFLTSNNKTASSSISFKLKQELLVHGYIQQQISKLLKVQIPVDIIEVCLLFFMSVFEVLKFSQIYKSHNGITLSDDNKCAIRAGAFNNHEYIIVDDKPVFKGIHCWRVKVETKTNNYKWIMFGVGQYKEYDYHSYNQGT